MHILFFGQQWEPEIGIPQRRGAWMTDVAHRHGVTYDVITAPPHYPHGDLISTDPRHVAGGVEEVQPGCRVWRTRFRPHTASIISRIIDQATISLSSLPLGWRAVSQHGPDVVMATAPPLPSILIAFGFAKTLRVPLVIDLRDAWPDLLQFLSEGKPSTRKRRLAQPLLKPALFGANQVLSFALRHADGIIATNAIHAHHLEQKFHTTTAHVSNIPLMNTDEDDPLSIETESIRRDGPLHVLYTGTVGRAQDLEGAVLATRLARDAGADVRLRIIGGGAKLRAVRDLAAELDLDIDVEFHKRMPRQDLRSHFEWADTILVQLKEWEPLRLSIPSKLYEAIASNKYVTAVMTGAGAQLVTSSNSGTVIRPGDPLALARHFIDLSHHRERLGKNAHGREWIRREKELQIPEKTLVEFMRDLTNG